MLLRGQLKPNEEWKELVDLFIARDLETIRSQQEQLKREEEEGKETEAQAEKEKKEADQKQVAVAEDDWD